MAPKHFKQRLFVLLALFPVAAHAQWLNFRTPGIPRTPDGKPDLSAPVPRAADGKPDLSGVWMHEITTVEEVKRLFGHRFDTAIQTGALGMEIGTQHKYEFDILLDFKPEESPMRPKERNCCAATPPAATTGPTSAWVFPVSPAPISFRNRSRSWQAPRMTMILYEAGNSHRQIYTDGRTLPKEFDLPAYLGYSVGLWQGETLVVETAGFNDKTVLDAMGHPHSDALRVIERYRRRDFGHLDVETTIDDPKMYTRPFTIKVPHDLLADSDIFENYCNDNEKDRVHLRK
jgi:hypothetical protein